MIELLGAFFLLAIVIIALYVIFYIFLFSSFFIVSYTLLEKFMPKWISALISSFVSIIGLAILFWIGLLNRTIFLFKILLLIIPFVILLSIFRKKHKKKILLIFSILFLISVVIGMIIVTSSPQNFICNDNTNKDLCYQNEGKKYSDVRFCDKIESPFSKKVCIGIVNKNPSICKNVTLSDAPGFSDPVSTCYSDIANGLKNISICDNIINENYKKSCLESWNKYRGIE